MSYLLNRLRTFLKPFVFLYPRIWLAATSTAGLLVCAPCHGASEEESPFVELFDGKTLAGWKGDPKYWRVEGGALVGEIPRGQSLNHNTWLIWEDGVLDDFDLQLQFRLTGAPAANSGVQFRCQAESVNRVSGYQADLDSGQTWLGRIYDEHGRGLLVERGTRVSIENNGQKTVERFADPRLFKVLFRENEWNDYRILASGEHVTVEINGTVFAEMIDRQKSEQDLSGELAFQLHSGPHTRIEFRAVRYRKLQPGQHRVHIQPQTRPEWEGVVPTADDGRELNLGFEDGTLRDWTATGDAFAGQPIKEDTISQRWAGQASGKEGLYFIGGYELLKDGVEGTLTSVPFAVTHPYASFLFAGGAQSSTRIDVVLADHPDKVVLSVQGAKREQMTRVSVDLRAHQGEKIFLKVVDSSSGAWGHLNFDDFRFHATKPVQAVDGKDARLRDNPLLSHLKPNPKPAAGSAAETVRQMYLEPGFIAEEIAAEPALHQPIAFTFDARGRIWVVEAHSYPQKRLPGEGKDKIVIFEDTDGDGAFETRKVFMEGLNLASGLEVGHGGVWIGAAPELLFIPDRNGDDRPDGEPEVLLNGFGYQDTHETLNNLIWGPDGWLYGNQGVFNYAQIGKPGQPQDERVALSAGVWRYHPNRHEFEVFAHGGSNQWGLDFSEVGQLFMTHCRSRWGRGLTTHVIQGGHFWDQSNLGSAEYISNSAPPGYPFFRNYLLASARYGHGEGGAGKRGSRELYGGHSHVGTMIYLGDNWPDDYRGHLFTHNLRGHQINQQINRREGSGYNTVHAGREDFYCPDPRYVAVDLKYGPDGAVYIIDWCDLQHCHNPNAEHWDRGNGRLYRMAYASTYRPASVSLSRASDAELVELQLHKNAWHGRTARRLLQERAFGKRLASDTRNKLLELARSHPDPVKRLRGLWALHAVAGLDASAAADLLNDEDEYVRAWTIQLLADDRVVSPGQLERFVQMAQADPSPVVRLYLASVIQRIPAPTGWRLVEALVQHAEDAGDNNLPRMIWYGLATLMPDNLNRAFDLARQTRIPVLSHYVHWYAAKLQGEGLNRMVAQLGQATQKQDLAETIALALSGQRDLPMPAAWPSVAPQLYQSANPRVQYLAHNLGSLFGDKTIFPLMRRT
ncbi:MAG: DUF1080 domain-containing protein, partial [Acidobacteria bacterium]|nr:DUF1080 domain-containing protein [Acidobacteriota bacterium]